MKSPLLDFFGNFWKFLFCLGGWEWGRGETGQRNKTLEKIKVGGEFFFSFSQTDIVDSRLNWLVKIVETWIIYPFETYLASEHLIERVFVRAHYLK